jgi:hypothetical protein
MSVNVDEYELKIDGVERNNVLDKFKDIDGYSYKSSFDNGYYPLIRDRSLMSDEEIIQKVMEKYPKSKIFFRIYNDFGEYAYEAENGKITELKKEWKKQT